MIRAALLALLCALPAAADPVAEAEAAAEDLRAAGVALSKAGESGDRIRALTQTIRAYEDALSILRDALRDAALRERAIHTRFESEVERIGSLLAVLQTMARSPEATVLLHPSGPTGTARAAMLVSEAVPALNTEAARLRAELEELEVLSLLRRNAVGTLEDGLADVQEARTQLADAVAQGRTTAHPTDLAALEALLTSADTLDAFASSLSLSDVVSQGAFVDAKGTLPLPVNGVLLSGFEQPDASGIVRPGLVLATVPQAIVTAPWPATVRYAGRLFDYGNVIILEPESGYLLVLAGLGTIFASLGAVVEVGDPIGLMAGQAEPAQGILIDSAGGGDRVRSQKLYMELRADDGPEDPADWFSLGKG